MRKRFERWLWERLTSSMIRRGWGAIWMRYFIASEVESICKDPIAAKRAGFQVRP